MERIQIMNADGGNVRQQPKVGDVITTLVKPPSDTMVELGCDRCAGPHRPDNAACSATLGITSHIANTEGLFHLTTGQRIKSSWEIVSESGDIR